MRRPPRSRLAALPLAAFALALLGAATEDAVPRPPDGRSGRDIYACVLENRFSAYVQEAKLVSGNRGESAQESRLSMTWKSFRDEQDQPRDGVLSKTLVRYEHPFDLRFSGYTIEEAGTTYEMVCGRICTKELKPSQLIFSGELGPRPINLLVQNIVNIAVSIVGAVLTLPLMAHALHEMIRCLAAATRQFTAACVRGLEADAARCRELVERSLMLVTALNPHIGYDRAAEVAKEAFATGRTLREVVLARGLLDAATLDRALNPANMTGAD